MSDKRLVKEIWRRFRDSGWRSDLERNAYSHTFEFSVDYGCGWEYVSYTLDDTEEGYCRVSYIGLDVIDLIRAVEALEFNKPCEFFWFDEPGEYRWFLLRKNEFVYVEAPGIEEGFFLYYDYFLSQLKRGSHR